MFDYRKSQSYFKNQYVPFGSANLSIGSSPVLYGLSIYTVFSVNYDKKTKKLFIFRLEDHYKRLINSAKIMDFHEFTETWTYKKFESVMRNLIKLNQVEEDVLVRVTVYVDELLAGTKIHGLKNNLSAYIYPMGEILPKNGIHACVSSWHRTPDNSIPSRAKINGSYVNASLMKNEALLNGYDEAIAIDSHGHVSEGTIANLFVINNGQLITPDTSTDILEGITRDSIFKIATSYNIPYIERTVDRSELYTADEAFVCGSSARIVPILSVDKRPISNSAGPITSLLISKYDAIQKNKVKKFTDWSLPV